MLAVLIVLGLAVPGFAQTPGLDTATAAGPFGPLALRQIDLGFFAPNSDTGSSKFLEYRSIPETGALPFLRLSGGEKLAYDLTVRNALQDDARYTLTATRGWATIDASFTKVPHFFGGDARSLLQGTGGGVFTVSSALQQQFQSAIEQQYRRSPGSVNFAFLNGLVSNSMGAVQPFDVRLQRDRGQVELKLAPDAPVDVRLSYFQENRRGSRGSGTAFGFGNVVETAEPVDYRTRDLGLSAEWTQPWGLVRGQVHLNQFTNHVPVQSFANPFRATDATDASAYQSPASASIGGASLARLALPPDNKAVTGSVGFMVKGGRSVRLSADASLGQWTQDEAFIPFTSNTAIRVPFAATDPSHLPVRSLDGKIDVFSLSSAFSARPVKGLSLTARYRRYDLDNKTPRVEFPEGYVRYDAVWEDIARISVPYGYTTDNATASVAYDFGPMSLEGGYKFDRMDRTFRETARTTQHTAYGSAYVKPVDWVVLRGTYERGSRSYDEYDPEHSEDASFMNPGPPANLTLLRRYDQAARDTDRVISTLQLSPGGDTTIAFSYAWGRENYKETTHGLIKADSAAYTAEVDYTPSERFNVFGFYTRENLSNFQRGRQSAATLSTNPLDDWTADVTDKADSFGGGANAFLIPDRLELRLLGSYQKVDGNNEIVSAVGGAPELARRALGGVASVALFDDTRFWSFNTELAYKLKAGWRLAVGAWYETYRVKDAASTGLPNYTPGAFFLAGLDGDYDAHVVYTRLSYTW
jgi:MtrB/PioB family decaheme-associated outer membrane protein